MKNIIKYIILRIQILLIIFYYFIFLGSSCQPTGTLLCPSDNPSACVDIYDNWTSISNGRIIFCIFLNNPNNVSFRLNYTIKKLFSNGSSCFLIEDDLGVVTSDTAWRFGSVTISDFPEGCNGAGQYEISTFAENTINNVRMEGKHSVVRVNVSNPFSLPLASQSIEPQRMEGNTTVNSNAMLQSITNTFHSPEADSDRVYVQTNFSTNYQVPDSNFVRNDNLVGNLIYRCNQYCKYYRQNDTNNYKFYLNFARYFLFFNPNLTPPRLDTTVIGISINSKTGLEGNPFIFTNFSFVFVPNIEHIYQNSTFSPYWQSVYNQTGSHELLHQLGNIFDGNAHTSHTGPYANKCALWTPGPDHFDNLEFRKLTTFYRVCDDHVNKLRGNIEIQSPFSGGMTHKTNIDTIKNEGIAFNLKLRKYTYKLYEPIIPIFEIINSSDDTIKFYTEFNDEIGDMNIQVSDDKGNKYSENGISKVITRAEIYPYFVTLPNDTLVTSMRINNWGKQINIFEKNPNDERDLNSRLGQRGFYPPGKYKLHIIFKDKNLKSNEVEFEVMDLDEIDKENLNLIKNDTNNSEVSQLILNSYNFSDSPFFEHYIADKIIKNQPYIYTNCVDFDTSKIINLYELFFDKFPNSNHLLQPAFLTAYFKLLDLNSNDIINHKNQMVVKYKDTLLSSYLKSKLFYLKLKENQLIN